MPAWWMMRCMLILLLSVLFLSAAGLSVAAVYHLVHSRHPHTRRPRR